MRDMTIHLCSELKGTDEIGQTISFGLREIEVYATKSSIAQKEFYSAAQAGLEPEFKIEISEFDYNGESIVRVDGDFYKVYRTYIRNDEIVELYCTHAKGIDTTTEAFPLGQAVWADLKNAGWI